MNTDHGIRKLRCVIHAFLGSRQRNSTLIGLIRKGSCVTVKSGSKSSSGVAERKMQSSFCAESLSLGSFLGRMRSLAGSFYVVVK